MIRVTVTGADKLTAFAKRIAPGSKPRALEALAKYFLGNDARGLRHYPPPRPSKYVRTYGTQARRKGIAFLWQIEMSPMLCMYKGTRPLRT